MYGYPEFLSKHFVLIISRNAVSVHISGLLNVKFQTYYTRKKEIS